MTCIAVILFWVVCIAIEAYWDTRELGKFEKVGSNPTSSS